MIFSFSFPNSSIFINISVNFNIILSIPWYSRFTALYFFGSLLCTFSINSYLSLCFMFHCTISKMQFLPVPLMILRNSGVTVCSLVCVTLRHMSICARHLIRRRSGHVLTFLHPSALGARPRSIKKGFPPQGKPFFVYSGNGIPPIYRVPPPPSGGHNPRPAARSPRRARRTA